MSRRKCLTFVTGLRIVWIMSKKNMPDEVLAYFARMGRKGGKKGGSVRAANMTADERSEAARKAVQARWDKEKRKK